MPAVTDMAREIQEIPEAIQRLLDNSAEHIFKASAALNQLDPPLVTTIARGSSDHAASYLKYAIELSAGVPVASTGPSIASIYGKALNLEGMATLAISQSGMSPDIVKMTEVSKRQGALSIAITNGSRSPLAISSDYAINISAGAEKSVAATKTFINSIVAGLLLLAHWQNDYEFIEAIERLPEQASKAINCDWSALEEYVAMHASLFILGRGPSFAIAQEAALKFKETCQIHAEAYSAAEVMHGPAAIVSQGFPMLVLAARDDSQSSVVTSCEKLADQGAQVFVTATRATHATMLPIISSGHPLTDPLLLIVSFYAFIEKLARRLELNPDQPPHLNKITETV